MKLFKDMDDNQFWLTLWALLMLTSTVAITIIGFILSYETHKLHDLVDKGHNPIELSCLFNSLDSTRTSCLLLAQARAEAILDKK